MSKILELKNINKTYKGTSETLHILKDLDLVINEGEFVSIIGKSGSGKSTLLNVIGLLDSIDEGEIYIHGEKVDRTNHQKIDLLKNRDIGFVFQFHYLLPEFTALENVMLPALLNNFNDKKNIEEKAKKILDSVGLKERYNHKPNQLSGGEKQRVAIARALINDPKIICGTAFVPKARGFLVNRVTLKYLKMIGWDKNGTVEQYFLSIG